MTQRFQFLSEIPAFHAGQRGDQVAVLCEGRTLTYGDLHERSGQAAKVLHDLGVKPGDRVAWLGRSHEAFFEVFFGAALNRACLAPINARLAIPEIAFILDDSGADIFFVTPGFFDTARAVLTQVSRPIRLIGVGGEDDDITSYEGLRDTAGAPPRLTPRGDDDVLQLYTSGTTGLPKGVRLTNDNYIAFLELSSAVPSMAYGPGDTLLCVMPLFHVAGTNMGLTGVANGSRIVVLPDFSPAETLRLIEAEGVGHTFLVPAMINMVLQAPQITETDLSSLTSVTYGASPISEAVLSAAKARFGCDFTQFYGMTETTGGGTWLLPEDHQGGLLRSCGKTWPGLEVRIVGEDGQEAAQGDIGEIQIKGPTVMAGYWNRPEATAQTINAQGWLSTGDAGFQDEQGYFFVHDRVKDMIVSGGENVYPAEVENAIHGCPGVADAAVIGVPDERWGEAVKAIVVAHPDSRPDPAEVIAWARQRIAGFKAPKSVDFIDVLPRNASGKVLRRELRKPYWERHTRNVG